MSAKLVPLGKNGPLVQQLGLGLMGLSYDTYGTIATDEERFVFLDRAYELGVRNFDGADLYGDSEELLGKWFKRTGKRNEIFLATKFGFIKGKTLELDSTGEYCKKACAESLRLLGTDYIDLYYLHHPNPKTPIEDSMRALKELQDEGKIRYIGLSAVSSTTLRRAIKIGPVACVQVEYSVSNLACEGSAGTNLLATCRELGVALVAATPLGRGLLTPTFQSGNAKADESDMRPKVMPQHKAENRDTNVAFVTQFKALAEKKNCSITQLALAFLLKQGDDVIPIPGTKKLKYLEENWKALEVHLTDEDEAEIRQFIKTNELAGSNMPGPFKDWEYRDTAEEA